MFIRIIQLLRKNKIKRIIFLAICACCLGAYPIYKNYVNGEGLTTYERHIDFINNKAEFYNPWQYRVLCPMIIEGAKYIYDHTVDKIYPFEKHIQFTFRQTSVPTPETKKLLTSLQQPDYVKYLIIFLLFRFVENIIIFILASNLFSHFIRNKWLIFVGLIIISWSMGNSVLASDLSFNTYLDIIFYLITANLIVFKKDIRWIIVITFFAAFNRETSLMIPWLVFISYLDISHVTFHRSIFKQVRFPSKKVVITSAISLIIYCVIFVAIRMHLGYRPQTVWKVPAGLAMLRLNLFSMVAIKSYFEMIGVFSVFPLICLYKFKRCSYILRIWFIGIVPVWFFVHLYSVVTYESRLFLVPTVLIFIPMLLEIVENYLNNNNKPEHENKTVVFDNLSP